jgi:hypothetical protein
MSQKNKLYSPEGKRLNWRYVDVDPWNTTLENSGYFGGAGSATGVTAATKEKTTKTCNKFKANWISALRDWNSVVNTNTNTNTIETDEKQFMKVLIETISIAEGLDVTFNDNYSIDMDTIKERTDGARGRFADPGIFGIQKNKKRTNEESVYKHGAMIEGIYRACLDVDQTPFIKSKWVIGQNSRVLREGLPVGNRSMSLHKDEKLFERWWTKEKSGTKKNLIKYAKECMSLNTEHKMITPTDDNNDSS